MGPKAAIPAPQEHDPDETLTALGRFMQQRNQDLGLSVAVVCERVGMSRASWYRIARGETASPAHRLLQGLARVYRVRASHLFALATQAEARNAVESRHLPRADDALWRCAYPGQIKPGRTFEVEFEVLNLSGDTWFGARLCPSPPYWIAVAGASRKTLPMETAAASATALPVSLPIGATGVGRWARLRTEVLSPPLPGRYQSCWALQMGSATETSQSVGVLCIEAS